MHLHKYTNCKYYTHIPWFLSHFCLNGTMALLLSRELMCNHHHHALLLICMQFVCVSVFFCCNAWLDPKAFRIIKGQASLNCTLINIVGSIHARRVKALTYEIISLSFHLHFSQSVSHPFHSVFPALSRSLNLKAKLFLNDIEQHKTHLHLLAVLWKTEIISLTHSAEFYENPQEKLTIEKWDNNKPIILNSD